MDCDRELYFVLDRDTFSQCDVEGGLQESSPLTATPERTAAGIVIVTIIYHRHRRLFYSALATERFSHGILPTKRVLKHDVGYNVIVYFC